MLHDAVVAGTGGAANLGSRMPTAGKTGTSTDSKDRWFIGFTPYYLAAVWTGFDTPARMSSSGNPAAQIWKMVMEPIHENLETRNFNKPADVTLTPVQTVWDVETVSYTVELWDINGYYGTVAGEAAEGAEITIYAPPRDGYVANPAYISLVISADPSRNVVRFTYSPAAPTPEPEPDPTAEPPPTSTPPPTPTPTTPTPCPVCGTPGCTITHKYCDICKKHDCGITHVYCNICGKYDCGITHTPTSPPVCTTPDDPENCIDPYCPVHGSG